MNEILKYVLAACSVILIIALNSIIFEAIFQLDMLYLGNIFWSNLFSFSATAVEISVVRIAMGKMKLRLVWE